MAVAKASVMLYDETNKKWVSSGSDGEQAISKVQIFQHQVHNTFRIVGRKVNVSWVWFLKIKNLREFL